MTGRSHSDLRELWEIYRHTEHTNDLAEYIQSGGKITDEVRREIVRCLSLVDEGKRNTHLKTSVIEDIDWKLTISQNNHIDHGTPLKSQATIFKEIADGRGMTVDAVKKIWQRKKLSVNSEEP
jgi:hypothetical protein